MVKSWNTVARTKKIKLPTKWANNKCNSAKGCQIQKSNNNKVSSTYERIYKKTEIMR